MSITSSTFHFQEVNTNLKNKYLNKAAKLESIKYIQKMQYLRQHSNSQVQVLPNQIKQTPNSIPVLSVPLMCSTPTRLETIPQLTKNSEASFKFNPTIHHDSLKSSSDSNTSSLSNANDKSDLIVSLQKSNFCIHCKNLLEIVNIKDLNNNIIEKCKSCLSKILPNNLSNLTNSNGVVSSSNHMHNHSSSSSQELAQNHVNRQNNDSCNLNLHPQTSSSGINSKNFSPNSSSNHSLDDHKNRLPQNFLRAEVKKVSFFSQNFFSKLRSKMLISKIHICKQKSK